MKEILVAPPYNCYFHVTPELWLQLNQCKVFEQTGSYTEYSYVEELERNVQTEFVDLNKLYPTPEVIEVQSIMEENNVLRRQVDALETQLRAAQTNNDKGLGPCEPYE